MRRIVHATDPLLAVVLLSVAAAWLTLHSPTLFFNHQILLGPSLGVFALLQYGWLGLPVGVSAALVTVALWGHPWAALILSLQLLWQQLFLSHFNGGPEQRGNGRIVLATIVFWLLVGLPLRPLLYTILLQGDLQSVIALALKEAVVSVMNTSLALLVYQVLLLSPGRRRQGDLSLRGLIFSTQLLMISLPGVLIIAALGQQITDQALIQFRLNLVHKAETVALLLPSDSNGLPANSPTFHRQDGLAFEAEASDGRQLNSDPILFSRLQQDYHSALEKLLAPKGLTLLVPNNPASTLQRSLRGYWRYQLLLPASPSQPWQRIAVVQPAHQQMDLLIGLMRPSLQIMGLLLIAAALISEALTTLMASQFDHILGSLALSTTAEDPNQHEIRCGVMPELQSSRLHELNRIVRLINNQGRIVNQLSRELQYSNTRLRLSEQQHRLLADNALDVITICDLTGQPSYISPSIEKVRGWTVAEAMVLPMDQQLRPEGCAFVRTAMQQTHEAINQGRSLPSFRVELEQSHKNGSWIWTDVTSSCMADETGSYIGTLLVYRDISERKRLERELLQRATIDELTGLLSRRALLEQVETLLAEPHQRRIGEGMALLFCDLDRFKEINDTLGHGTGDLVLCTVAERIRQCTRSGDLAARMGGDEMVVVLRAVPDTDAAMAIAEKLRAASHGVV